MPSTKTTGATDIAPPTKSPSGRARLLFTGVLICAAGSLAANGVMAQGLEIDVGETTGWTQSWERFHSGWRSLLSWPVMVSLTLELFLSVALAALIAFHPRNYRSGFVASLEMLDQPKTLLMYAMVATIVAEIVQVYPAMAFVVFGIGGLMRFRTDLGMPKLTGRAILVTVNGLAAGLELFPLAILGALFGWVLIFLLEKRATVRVRIRKLDVDRLEEAVDAWTEMVERVGGQVASTMVNPTTAEIELLLVIPTNLDRQALRRDVPEALRGKIDVRVA